MSQLRKSSRTLSQLVGKTHLSLLVLNASLGRNLAAVHARYGMIVGRCRRRL